MKSWFVRSSALAALTALVAACGGGDGGETASPGSGLEGPDRTLAWNPEEVYSVGGFDAPDWATFGSIEGLGFDSQGNLYLLDGQTQTITQVSPTGEFVKTISGPGEGPGELAQPMGFGVSPTDELIVSDIGHRGFVRFATDGEWIENAPVDMSRAGLLQEMEFLPDGSPIGSSQFRISMNSVPPSGDDGEEEPEGRAVHRFALDGSGAEAFHYAWEPPPPPEGGESELTGGSGGNTMMIRMSRLRAFTPQLHLVGLPDGRVALADSTTYRISLIDPVTGAEVGEVSRPIPPTSVDERIRQMERDRRLGEVEERDGGVRVLGGPSMSFDQEAMRNMLLEQIENMAFYDEIPVIEAMDADSEGRLWVQRSSGIPGEDGPTDILTPNGEYVGTLPADGLRIPDAFGPNGLIAVIETDEFDVPTIRVMRVPTN